eukprot:4090540-Pleurochrysis_carterae.AAC.1
MRGSSASESTTLTSDSASVEMGSTMWPRLCTNGRASVASASLAASEWTLARLPSGPVSLATPPGSAAPSAASTVAGSAAAAAAAAAALAAAALVAAGPLLPRRGKWGS